MMSNQNWKTHFKNMAATLALTLASAVTVHATPSIEAICNKDGIECLMSEAGVVVGTPGNTAAYSGGMDRAAAQFQAYFGEPAPKAAVILGEVLDQDIRTQLRGLYPVVLPWFTIEDRKAMIAHSVRRQIAEQRPELTGAALDAVVEQSVEASLKASSSGGDEGIHQGVFAHELGHLYFIRAFWPDNEVDVVETNPEAVTQYAGPAPDWLDEMAAVLMENDALTQGRVESLVKASVADDDLRSLWPLEEYFEMVHPVFEQARRVIEARQASAEGRARGGVVMLTRDQLEIREDERNPALFYAQSRGFADYLIEKTDNQQIFADVARHMAAGGTMVSWLETRGQSLGIPASISALETDFRSWLQGRYSGGLPSGHSHGHAEHI